MDNHPTTDTIELNNKDVQMLGLDELKSNPMDEFDSWMVTQDAVDKFCNPDFIIPNLLIKTHILALCGQPGAGKTTILMHLCSKMAAAGYKVLYFNYDISSGDFKRDFQMAIDGGFTIIADVDVHNPRSPESVIDSINATASDPDADISKHIFIFDTLKKFTDVGCKKALKTFMNMCRRITNKGGTVILPCHANKYLDENGFPVFDGVGDLRNDTDELLYLVPRDGDDGCKMVSVEMGDMGKVRGDINPTTFRLNKDRTVSEIDYVNVVEQNVEDKMLNDDQYFIQMIIEAINNKCCTQVAIVNYCANQDGEPMGQRKTRAILKKYDHNTDGPVRWYSQKGMSNNSWNYGLQPL